MNVIFDFFQKFFKVSSKFSRSFWKFSHFSKIFLQFLGEKNIFKLGNFISPPLRLTTAPAPINSNTYQSIFNNKKKDVRIYTPSPPTHTSWL